MIDEIIKHYRETRNVCEVQRRTGRSRHYIYQVIRNAGLFPKAKNASYSRGSKENHPLWKGGKSISPEGYVRILMREHPRANSNGYIREHIIVAERKIGRALKYFGKGHPDNEVVHHINGIKTDNRPENLQILTNAEHMRLEWSENQEKWPQSPKIKLSNIDRFEKWRSSNERPKK